MKPSFKLLGLLCLIAAPSFSETGLAGTSISTSAVVFPDEHVFHKLIADPREMQLAAAYYRLSGRDMGDAALGHRWGMERWSDAHGTRYQWDLEGMVYSRFQLGLGINYFETADYLVNLPLEIRRGPYSAKLSVFHESSHLGDGYIRQTGDLGFNYSVNGARALFSLDVGRFLRLYGGGAYLIDVIPTNLGRGVLQAGFEIHGPDFYFRSLKNPFFAFLAEDAQSHQDTAWNPDSNTDIGIGLKSNQNGRAIRLQLGYFSGHSPFGQFYALRQHYADVALVFDF